MKTDKKRDDANWNGWNRGSRSSCPPAPWLRGTGTGKPAGSRSERPPGDDILRRSRLQPTSSSTTPMAATPTALPASTPTGPWSPAWRGFSTSRTWRNSGSGAPAVSRTSTPVGQLRRPCAGWVSTIAAIIGPLRRLPPCGRRSKSSMFAHNDLTVTSFDPLSSAAPPPNGYGCQRDSYNGGPGYAGTLAEALNATLSVAHASCIVDDFRPLATRTSLDVRCKASHWTKARFPRVRPRQRSQPVAPFQLVRSRWRLQWDSDGCVTCRPHRVTFPNLENLRSRVASHNPAIDWNDLGEHTRHRTCVEIEGQVTFRTPSRRWPPLSSALSRPRRESISVTAGLHRFGHAGRARRVTGASDSTATPSSDFSALAQLGSSVRAALVLRDTGFTDSRLCLHSRACQTLFRPRDSRRTPASPT
jgi:hypothetical protein